MMFKAASLFAFVALVFAQSDPSINTPASVVQCQPVQLTWTASKTPIYLSVIPGGQPGATPLVDLGSPTGNSMTWKCNQSAGTSITFQLKDSTGAVVYSGNVPVQTSSDSSCVGQSGSVIAGGSSAPAGSSSGAATPASSGAATPVSSVSSAPATASGPATSPASAAQTTSSPASSPMSTMRASSSAAPAQTSAGQVSPNASRPAASSAQGTTRASASASASAPSSNAAVSVVQVGWTGAMGFLAAVVGLAIA